MAELKILEEISAYDNEENVMSFLEKNPSLLVSVDQFGNTPLHYACTTDSSEIIKIIVDFTPDRNALNQEHRTPFFIASVSPGMKILDFCYCEFRPDVQLTDVRGANVLHWAVREGNEEKISYLMDKGVNINAPALDNRTPCDVPSKNPSLRPDEGILKTMKEKQEIIKLAFKAIKNGSTDIQLAYSYEKYLDEYGCTLLHQCAKYNNLAIAERFVQYIHNNDKDIFGRTPLRCALVYEASPALIQLFKDNQGVSYDLREPNVKGEEANHVQFTNASGSSASTITTSNNNTSNTASTATTVPPVAGGGLPPTIPTNTTATAPSNNINTNPIPAPPTLPPNTSIQQPQQQQQQQQQQQGYIDPMMTQNIMRSNNNNNNNNNQQQQPNQPSVNVNVNIPPLPLPLPNNNNNNNNNNAQSVNSPSNSNKILMNQQQQQPNGGQSPLHQNLPVPVQRAQSQQLQPVNPPPPPIQQPQSQPVPVPPLNMQIPQLQQPQQPVPITSSQSIQLQQQQQQPIQPQPLLPQLSSSQEQSLTQSALSPTPIQPSPNPSTTSSSNNMNALTPPPAPKPSTSSEISPPNNSSTNIISNITSRLTAENDVQLIDTVRQFLTSIDLQSYIDVLEQNGIYWVAQLIEQKENLQNYITKEGHLREVKKYLTNLPGFTDPVPSFLKQHNLTNYNNSFKNAKIDTTLRLSLLKDSDLEKIGVKKGHRKDILHNITSPPPCSLNLSTMEYDLFLSILRISHSRNELIENGYDKIPLLANLDYEACQKYGIQLGDLKQIEYELGDIIKQKKAEESIEIESEPPSPSPTVDLRKISIDNGLGDYIDTLLENGYDTLERIKDISKSDLEDMGIDDKDFDDILNKIQNLTPKRLSKSAISNST